MRNIGAREVLLLTKNRMKDFYLERPSGAEGSLLNPTRIPVLSSIATKDLSCQPKAAIVPGRSSRIVLKTVCTAPRSALRCTHLPPSGGFHVTTDTASRTLSSPGLHVEPAESATDRQIRSDSSWLGSRSRHHGNQRRYRSRAETRAH